MVQPTFTINDPTGASLNGVSNSDTGFDFTRPVDLVTNNREFTFEYLPPLSGDTSENGRYSLGWFCTTGGSGQGQTGTVSNITVTGIGGIYSRVEAPIFLTQEDEGYNNQADYQNMGPTDISGNVISPINLIQNTQSVIFNNSDYNPLSNNVNTNRSSSNRYILSYGATQSVPNNFDLVVTASYFPTSPSGTFPELADVPDSNYTMPSSVNARYAGTKLSSLTYNIFTPSGSIGPEVQLRPRHPLTQNNIRVALEFLDGSVTSSFDQKPLGEGLSSWQGDSRQNRGESTIDKHPIYMARFENSYEQLNLYNSYQFNIDQLIQVPFEDIAGSEITPNSITIDGSNENKKVVSSVFEPKRQASISYLNPKTPAIDYTTLTIGNFDILSGATEFLTINSNAKNRTSGSLSYQYSLGGTPSTGSRNQLEDTIQMVTSSQTVGDPIINGVLNGSLTSQGVTPVLTGIPTTIPVVLVGVPIASGTGTGATVTITFNVSGVFQTAIIDNNGGTGYIQGDRITILSETLNTFAFNANFNKATTTVDLILVVDTSNVTGATSTITTNGFLLSGSLTTDAGIGDNVGVVGAQIRDTSISAGPAGTYSNLPNNFIRSRNRNNCTNIYRSIRTYNIRFIWNSKWRVRICYRRYCNNSTVSISWCRGNYISRSRFSFCTFNSC